MNGNKRLHPSPLGSTLPVPFPDAVPAQTSVEDTVLDSVIDFESLQREYNAFLSASDPAFATRALNNYDQHTPHVPDSSNSNLGSNMVYHFQPPLTQESYHAAPAATVPSAATATSGDQHPSHTGLDFNLANVASMHNFTDAQAVQMVSFA